MSSPKNNLPPDSQMWVRDVESRLATLELQRSNLDTLTQGTNSRLGPLVRSTNTLNETVNYLSEQLVLNSMDMPQFSTTPTFSTTATDVQYPFDPAYDVDLKFATRNSGMVTVIFSEDVNIIQTAGSGTNPSIYASHYYDMTIIGLPTYVAASTEGVGTIPRFSNGSLMWQSGAYKPNIVNYRLNANTQYRLNSTRHYNGSMGTGTASYMITWQPRSVLVIVHK